LRWCAEDCRQQRGGLVWHANREPHAVLVDDDRVAAEAATPVLGGGQPGQRGGQVDVEWEQQGQATVDLFAAGHPTDDVLPPADSPGHVAAVGRDITRQGAAVSRVGEMEHAGGRCGSRPARAAVTAGPGVRGPVEFPGRRL
jgi:hypothetical protein